MNDQPSLDLQNSESDDSLNLATYAQRAYLEYALSVVKGRALPDVCDGQKPVQRRILYSMSRMGLGFGGPNGAVGARPVKSARVVGDVGGAFAQSVIITAGASSGVTKGQVVMTGEGLVGRVTQAGNASSRVLLITDINSRIPVLRCIG